MKYVNHHKNKNSLFIHSSISGLFSRGLPSAPILEKYYFDIFSLWFCFWLNLTFHRTFYF